MKCRNIEPLSLELIYVQYRIVLNYRGLRVCCRHAARIAAMTVPRVSWEDFKKQQKAAEQLEATTEADEAEKMRKYRAQLDADRAAKLAKVQCFRFLHSVACCSLQALCKVLAGDLTTSLGAQGTNHAHFREPVAEVGTSASKKRKHSDKEKSSKRSKDKDKDKEKDKDKKHKKHKSDSKDKGSKRSKNKKSKSESSKAKNRKEKKQNSGESTGSSGSSSGSESS